MDAIPTQKIQMKLLPQSIRIKNNSGGRNGAMAVRNFRVILTPTEAMETIKDWVLGKNFSNSVENALNPFII